MDDKAFYQKETAEILAHLSSFHGDVPTHRRESKRTYTFSHLPFGEQLAIWDLVWRTQAGFWTRVHAFFCLERHMKKEEHLRQMWPVIVKWQDDVDDWGLCDSLSKIYTRILETMPGEVYGQLRQWNIDTDLWKRRQSVVSLLYYSRTKKVYLTFDQIQPLINNLLNDREYYVQKGIGWALREMHNVYQVETMAFLKTNIKSISSTAFPTTIEKMTPEQVRELKMLRGAK